MYVGITKQPKAGAMEKLCFSNLLFSVAQAVFSDVMYGFMPLRNTVAWLFFFLFFFIVVLAGTN